MTQTLLMKGVTLVCALMMATLIVFVNPGTALASTTLKIEPNGGTALANNARTPCYVYTDEFGWIHNCDLYLRLLSPFD